MNQPQNDAFLAQIRFQADNGMFRRKTVINCYDEPQAVQVEKILFGKRYSFVRTTPKPGFQAAVMVIRGFLDFSKTE